MERSTVLSHLNALRAPLIRHLRNLSYLMRTAQNQVALIQKRVLDLA
jgi:hypothetical protein